MSYVFHAVASHSLSHVTTLHQFALTVSHRVAKEGEFATHNKSMKLSGGVKLCTDTLVCSVFSITDS